MSHISFTYIVAVITAKLTYRYAASAWWGFTSAVHRQPTEAVVRRAKRTGLRANDVPTLMELVGRADELFEKFSAIRMMFYVTLCLMKQYSLIDSVGGAIMENL